jgi:bifunctional oligoribonuclease and PAP phosphatase NrnA
MNNGPLSPTIRQAASEIRKATEILLVCHERPDADALGSLLALAGGLDQLGKRVQAVSPDGVPPLYRFLPGWQRIATAARGKPDLAIGLDADGSHRLGTAAPSVLAAPCIIDLDHHTGAARYGHICVVDPTAAATGELVYALLGELQVALTLETATCLLAALVTDTGSFRFSNTRAETFDIAADLVRHGAHPGPIYEAIYGTRPFAASRLLGRLLAGMERSPDGKIVWGVLALSDFDAAGVEPDSAEGFVDQIRMVEGSSVAIYFREDRDGGVRVSLRSRGDVNVARVAEEFQGGGHAPAAGCTVPGPFDKGVRRVLDAVRRHLP